MTISGIASAIKLVISTASPALSLALFEGEILAARYHRLIGRGHAEALVPAIAALMGCHRADAIIVDIGPGSFTGIRIGIAGARALGLAWGVPVTGCEAGALIAAQAFALRPGLAAVTVLMDAGRGQVLRQRIDADYTASAMEAIAATAVDVADGEALAGPALIHLRDGDFVHDNYPDAAFALHLPPAQRDLAPRAQYLRPPDAMLPL